jgi:hypothetical protein
MCNSLDGHAMAHHWEVRENKLKEEEAAATEQRTGKQ